MRGVSDGVTPMRRSLYATRMRINRSFALVEDSLHQAIRLNVIIGAGRIEFRLSYHVHVVHSGRAKKLRSGRVALMNV